MAKVGKHRRTILCPECGTIQPVGSNCSICGHPIVAEKYIEYETCHACGKARPVDSLCPYCGDPARCRG